MDEGNITDLTSERNRRAQPDPEFVRKDEYGRPLYTFLLSYEAAGKTWQTEVWAYDLADAEMKVEGMRASLKVLGQAFSTIPA